MTTRILNQRMLALGLVAALACSDGSSPTDTHGSVQGTGDSSITGEVNGLVFFGPDSGSVPVPSRVQVYFIGPIPAESLPPGPDGRGSGGQLAGILHAFDGDTIISPPPPPPPPPPPIEGCGRTGELVADVQTDANGEFDVSSLEAGVYDLHATALDASAFGDSYTCAVGARSGVPTVVNLFVPTTNLSVRQ